MASHDSSQDNNSGTISDPYGMLAASPTSEDIARCIRRAQAERAAYIQARGHQMWETLSSLWRRPGSQIPSSYRTH